MPTMVDQSKEALALFLMSLRARGITDRRLLSAFEAVPRRNFVPVIHITEAYAGGQMPIECGQSMTSVTRVAQTLVALDVEPEHRVLELGTGTGYQTGLLANLAAKVVSLERYRTLHEKAAYRLGQLELNNAFVKLKDGAVPDPELGSHDRIVANFAFENVPSTYIDNLASNGIMIAPVGPVGGRQMVKKITKIGSRLQVEDLFEVRMQHPVRGISKAI